MVHKIILDLCDLVLAESLKKEIIATIHHELGNKYDEKQTEMFINDFFNAKYDDVPEEIRTIGISVSFDMGWQKRLTGRLYDSISGHGYLIRCRTKNIIAMGLKKKEMQFMQQSKHKRLTSQST